MSRSTNKGKTYKSWKKNEPLTISEKQELSNKVGYIRNAESKKWSIVDVDGCTVLDGFKTRKIASIAHGKGLETGGNVGSDFYKSAAGQYITVS
jgi:hypothetical protein